MSNNIKKRKLGLADLIIGLIYAPFMIVLMPWLLVVGVFTTIIEFLKDGTLPSWDRASQVKKVTEHKE